MASFRLLLNDRKLKKCKNDELYSGAVNVDSIAVEFGNAWEPYDHKYGVFYTDPDKPYVVEIQDNVVGIPSEVLIAKGFFYFGIYGANESQRLTSSVLKFKVDEGSRITGATPSTPVVDIYTKLGEIDALREDLEAIKGRESVGKYVFDLVPYQTVELSDLDFTNYDVENVDKLPVKMLTYMAIFSMVGLFNGMDNGRLKNVVMVLENEVYDDLKSRVARGDIVAVRHKAGYAEMDPELMDTVKLIVTRTFTPPGLNVDVNLLNDYYVEVDGGVKAYSIAESIISPTQLIIDVLKPSLAGMVPIVKFNDSLGAHNVDFATVYHFDVSDEEIGVPDYAMASARRVSLYLVSKDTFIDFIDQYMKMIGG